MLMMSQVHKAGSMCVPYVLLAALLVTLQMWIKSVRQPTPLNVLMVLAATGEDFTISYEPLLVMAVTSTPASVGFPHHAPLLHLHMPYAMQCTLYLGGRPADVMSST